MVDISKTIQPKSDQLNADDLISGPITIKITEIRGQSNQEQPVSIHFEGDNGKPYKPCKSMRRLMCYAWGADGKSYVGRYMTIFRDESVKWAGKPVGGIRISHMSHIDGVKVTPLTESKNSRKPYRVEPLEVQQPAQPMPTYEEWSSQLIQALEVATQPQQLNDFYRNNKAVIESFDVDTKAYVLEQLKAKKEELNSDER